MKNEIVRNNLLTEKGYTPYCGNMMDCKAGAPRTTFTGEQFKCTCGWESHFPEDFMTEYKATWNTDDKV